MRQGPTLRRRASGPSCAGAGPIARLVERVVAEGQPRRVVDLDDALERRRVDRRDELVHVREELDLALLLERGLREQLVDLVVDLVQVLAARARDPLHLGRRVRLVAAAGRAAVAAAARAARFSCSRKMAPLILQQI